MAPISSAFATSAGSQGFPPLNSLMACAMRSASLTLYIGKERLLTVLPFAAPAALALANLEGVFLVVFFAAFFAPFGLLELVGFLVATLVAPLECSLL